MKIGKIEKGVPYDASSGARGKWKTLITKMEVGDSVLITLGNDDDIRNVQSSFYGSIARYRELGVFRSRKVTGGLRIWRVE